MAESMTFTVVVESMERESVAAASVVLVGGDNDLVQVQTRVKIKLDMPPHKARAMPFASTWRLTLEQIEFPDDDAS